MCSARLLGPINFLSPSGHPAPPPQKLGGHRAAAEAISSTRLPPSVKLGSLSRWSLRPHLVEIPLWVCKKKNEVGRDNQMLQLYSAHVWELRRVFSEAWHASSAWDGSVFVLLNSFTLRAMFSRMTTPSPRVKGWEKAEEWCCEETNPLLATSLYCFKRCCLGALKRSLCCGRWKYFELFQSGLTVITRAYNLGPLKLT